MQLLTDSAINKARHIIRNRQDMLAEFGGTIPKNTLILERLMNAYGYYWNGNEWFSAEDKENNQ